MSRHVPSPNQVLAQQKLDVLSGKTTWEEIHAKQKRILDTVGFRGRRCLCGKPNKNK